jgi:hypothetical protein
MSNGLHEFGKTATGLSRNPLGIIALFIVLVYGVAGLVTAFASSLGPTDRTPLIWFLVLFPVLVLAVFAWLVSRHFEKLYGPADYKDEKHFVAMQLAAAASLAVASDRRGEQGGQELDFRTVIDAVLGVSRDGRIGGDSRQSMVLWVDNTPDNNVYERRAFEAIGLSFSLALSTDEALDVLERNRFGAIISDMGRPEGRHAGYDLLQAVRAKRDETPFFIYAGSDSLEYRREAEKRGAQGSTNSPEKLFRMVTGAVIRGENR